MNSSSTTGNKLWGGRFTDSIDPLFEQFNASISFDQRMWAEDLEGSRAYTLALQRAGILTCEETAAMQAGLVAVSQEWAEGKFQLRASDEDIHTANERRLSELVGETAKKIHTGRSRNDQVATDLRLWLRKQTHSAIERVRELVVALAARAEQDVEVLMPGFTHLQPAQPIRWSHLLLSYAAAFQRDAGRLYDSLPRLNTLPLGSGALAGNSFGVDRELLASELHFSSLSLNSIDAVSDRDFVAEFLFAGSLLMVHLSQMAEDLILLCSRKLVTCADAYSTGSSLMPQKKNPDALELLRGKSGRVMGSLHSVLVLLKSLPRAYNKDLQEDKEALFDAVNTLLGCLPIAAGIVSTLTVHADAMRALLTPDMLATDLADYLVRKGVPFRDTHHVAGAAVRLAEARHAPLSSLTLTDLQKLHPAFTEDVSAVWNFEASVEKKNSTSRAGITTQIRAIKDWSLTAVGELR